MSLLVLVLGMGLLVAFTLRDRARFGTAAAFEFLGTIAVFGVIGCLRYEVAGGNWWPLPGFAGLMYTGLTVLTHGHPLWLLDNVTPLELGASERRTLVHAQRAALGMLLVLGLSVGVIASS